MEAKPEMCHSHMISELDVALCLSSRRFGGTPSCLPHTQCAIYRAYSVVVLFLECKFRFIIIIMSSGFKVIISLDWLLGWFL